MKRLLFILPALAFLGLLVAFALGLTRDPARLPSMLIGKPLPAFALPGLTAGDAGLNSARLRGEPALLDVFASWCPSCRAQHPMLERLSREGVAIYGLAWKDEPADTSAYLGELGDPFRAVGSDPAGRVGIDLGVSGTPETFVVDRHGVVRYRHVGPITPEVWDTTLRPLYARLRAER